MFQRISIQALDDYFKESTLRPKKGIYFGRLTVYNEGIDDFLYRFFLDARKNGIYVKGKIPNPDERQLEFYQEMMGNSFQFNLEFLKSSLDKWLPRLNPLQCNAIAEAMFSVLDEMLQEGKTENMLKNAYIKFMCWFYYKLERILSRLGQTNLPKILYEGNISRYELNLLSICAKAGCDVLLLQYDGDTLYQNLDPASKESDIIVLEGKPFPKDFSLEALQQKKTQVPLAAPILSGVPKTPVGTNIWITGNVWEDALIPLPQRGDGNGFYNLFARILGAEDASTYLNELFKWKLKMETSGKTVVIVDESIPSPTMAELQKIQRKNYRDMHSMITDMLQFLSFPKSKELEDYIKQGFVQVLEEEKDSPLQRLNNRGIVLISWLQRYLPQLFPQWNSQSLPVFIYYSTCNNQNEVSFLKLLSTLPVDVLIICPDLSRQCKLEDNLLYEKKFGNSLPCDKFPTQIDNVTFGTVAYHAEQDLNTIMYQDTGIYRNRQFQKALPISLKTTFEEISILWNQEAKYRPDFEALQDRVILPVIFSKISGVSQNKEVYWEQISGLFTEDTFFIPSLPYIKPTDFNPIKAHAVNFLKNGKVQWEKIKNHPAYPYSFLREDMQDYMLDKLQQLIDKKVIRGTFSQGTEYTILATALNLDKKLIRLVQKFDFTKQIPKLILLHTGEGLCSLEDSILVSYLNLLGFDIAIFVPTGYQTVEKFYQSPLLVEHQIGDYMYDLKAPHLPISRGQIENITSKLLRRISKWD